MKTKVDGEIEEVRQLKAEVAKIENVIRQMSPEKRAYCIIKSFIELEDPDEDTKELFHRWLLSSGNDEVKTKAMERYFAEAMDNYFNDEKNEINKKTTVG